MHDADHGTAGSAPLVMAQLAPERLALSPARPERPLRPERPVPPGGPGLASGGSDPLARAVQLVEQGADTLERTRRGQYRG